MEARKFIEAFQHQKVRLSHALFPKAIRRRIKILFYKEGDDFCYLPNNIFFCDFRIFFFFIFFHFLSVSFSFLWSYCSSFSRFFFLHNFPLLPLSCIFLFLVLFFFFVYSYLYFLTFYSDNARFKSYHKRLSLFPLHSNPSH